MSTRFGHADWGSRENTRPGNVCEPQHEELRPIYRWVVRGKVPVEREIGYTEYLSISRTAASGDQGLSVSREYGCAATTATVIAVVAGVRPYASMPGTSGPVRVGPSA